MLSPGSCQLSELELQEIFQKVGANLDPKIFLCENFLPDPESSFSSSTVKHSDSSLVDVDFGSTDSRHAAMAHHPTCSATLKSWVSFLFFPISFNVKLIVSSLPF